MSTPFLRGNNLLGNSRLSFWQRGISSLNASGNVYLADRFRLGNDVPSGGIDISRNTDVPTSQADYSYSLARATASTPTGLTGSRIVQPVEGNIFKQIRGKKFTLFFWAKSSKIGPQYVALKNSAANRLFLQRYNITVADTWQSFQFQLTHDEAGSWLYDSGMGLEVSWMLQAGSSINIGTAGSWQTVAITTLAANDQVNTFDASNSYFRLALPMIVPGHVILDPNNLPLTRRHEDELRFCQRYYYGEYGFPNAIPLYGIRYAGTSPWLTIPLPVSMRALPVVSTSHSTIFASAGTINSVAPRTGAQRLDHVAVDVLTSNTSVDWGINLSFSADAEF